MENPPKKTFFLLLQSITSIFQRALLKTDNFLRTVKATCKTTNIFLFYKSMFVPFSNYNLTMFKAANGADDLFVKAFVGLNGEMPELKEVTVLE